jgi:serine/threonine protein kinase
VETFGKYSLIERVAVGGMAEIYKAKTVGMSGFERVVAIKRLHYHLSQDNELAQMLVDEAKIAVLLNHPNIGQVFDLGQVNGQYFMVMEFIDGPDLHRVLRRMREQQLYAPIPIVLHIIAEACGALDFAHNIRGHDGQPLQLVHRDISPQNIMLTTSGEVKLVDFGIAKARHRMMETQAGIIKGKFYYMAPEQAFGHHLDPRTDIFAMGMVLYEALVGRAAYEDTDDLNLLKRARNAEYHPPTTLRPDLDPALEAIVLRALQREPQRRYQSARELQAALRQYILQHYGEVDRYQIADFVQQLNAMPVTSGRLPVYVSPQQVMDRKDYQISEDSLLYRGQLPESTEPTHPAHFSEGMMHDPQMGGFEDDGPTYVYSRDEDNPFAVPDILNGPPSQASSDPTLLPHHTFPASFQPAPPAYSNPDQALPSGFLAAPPVARPPDPRPSASPGADLRRDGPRRGPSAASASTTHRFNLGAIPPKARIAAGVALALVLGGIVLAVALSSGDDKQQANAAVKPGAVATPQVAPAPTYQTVSVHSTPSNAQVFLDGTLVGTTPMALASLKIGQTYALKVTTPGKPAWEQELTVTEDHEPIAVDFSTLASTHGVLKIVTNPPGLRVELDGRAVGKSPVEVTEVDREADHTVVAVLEDGTMRRQIVSWLEDEPEIKSVEISFVDDITPSNALPKPPQNIRTSSPKKAPVRKYTPKKNTKPSPKEEDEELNIWDKGDKKAAPKKAEPRKKPAKKDDDEEPLISW